MNNSESMKTSSSPYTIKVTFTVYSAVLKKSFVNVELHRSEADANLRALALNWQIAKVEAI